MTQEPWDRVSDAPLYAEHLLLGASYDSEERLLAAPTRYGLDDDASDDEGDGRLACALADLSGMRALLVSGDASEAFVSATFARDALAVGECAFSAVLTGDGSVATVPLLARTGDREFLAWDPTERGQLLEPWLSFVAAIEQQGYRPYEGVALEGVDASLVPLLLWGAQAPSVLGDYVSSPELLPGAGEVRNVTLDSIATLVARPLVGDDPCYLVLVPPVAARAIWRSLLSFSLVTPVGTDWLVRAGERELPWLAALRGGERLSWGLGSLGRWDLARREGGFVGWRALGA